MINTAKTDTGKAPTVFKSGGMVIEFNYDQVASELKKLKDRREALLGGSSGELDKVGNFFNQIKEVWLGTDSDAFTDKYTAEYGPYLEKIIAELDKYITAIELAYKTYQTVEEKILSR